MASDSLNQIGRGIRQMNRRSDLAMKRVTNRIPKRERARDTVSSVFPFSMRVDSEGQGETFLVSINFNKPPPVDCAAGCFATACVAQVMGPGGHLMSVTNPYEAGSVNVFSNGVSLDQSQWVEENPSAGQIYVQVQTGQEMIVICYTYIIC